MAARRRLPVRQRLPGCSVHASRLGVLDPVRHEDDGGRAGLGPGSLPDRLRHRGRAQRARRPRRRRQRGVPCRNARRSVSDRRRRSRRRAGAGSGQLQHLCDVQRPGRQSLADAGGHGAAPGPHRRRRDVLRIDRGPGERDAARVGRPRRARAAHRRARRELAGLVRRIHGRGAGR